MKLSLNKMYIGTMSGTSFDGIDVCAISVGKSIKLVQFDSFKYPAKLKKEISIAIEHQILGLQDYLMLHQKIGMAFAGAINNFILKNSFTRKEFCAIGLSGQTLFHQPNSKYPFSIQAGDAGIISKECGIDVVSDFRNDHIKLGGEGAPLVPEFHQKIFSSSNKARLIINIGGIANYSFLKNKQGFLGSDSGPGNALMDSYCQKYLNCAFDRNGLIARKGVIHQPSLEKMLAHPFFKKEGAKSTGKEMFNLKFIPKILLTLSPEDILATLVELTAITISVAIKSYEKSVDEIIICGGGIKNTFMQERISRHVLTPLKSSEVFGYPPQAIESMAFGWLASQRMDEKKMLVKRNKGLLGKINKFKL